MHSIQRSEYMHRRKLVDYREVKAPQATISPESTSSGVQGFAPGSSISLGTLKSRGLYRYHPFNAATAALVLASSRLEPAPSPSLSLPEYTPTTNTGCLLFRPVSLNIRATGDLKPSLAQSRLKSLVGILKLNRSAIFNCRDMK